MYSSDKLFRCSWESYVGVYETETISNESTYINLFLTRYNESINDDNESLHIVPVSRSLSFRSADDITIDCWWCRNDQTIVTRSRE